MLAGRLDIGSKAFFMCGQYYSCQAVVYVLLMPECALCSSAIILLRAGLGITIFALSFIMSSVPFSGSAMESVLRTIVYSCKGELVVSPDLKVWQASEVEIRLLHCPLYCHAF